MNLLAIDTSTRQGSVALLAGDRVLLEENFLADRLHSSTLFAVLERARAQVSSIDRVAVGLGPGSYAGVRIAIAAGIGLHLGMGAQLLGLASVAALEVPEPAYLAIGDARRETFYFTDVEDGVCREGPLLATEPELRAHLAVTSLPIYACAELPAFPEARLALPSAKRLAQLARQERGVLSRGDLEPIYLREPHITQPKPR